MTLRDKNDNGDNVHAVRTKTPTSHSRNFPVAFCEVAITNTVNISKLNADDRPVYNRAYRRAYSFLYYSACRKELATTSVINKIWHEIVGNHAKFTAFLLGIRTPVPYIRTSNP